MPEMTFCVPDGQTVARKMLILALNTSTADLPKWAPMGLRVADSSLEMDWGKETFTDIYGNVHTTLKTPTTTQKFDPWPLQNGDAAQKKIWDIAISEKVPFTITEVQMRQSD